jgi:hypothetical protein
MQRHAEAAAMRKKKWNGEEHNELPRDPLGGRSFLSSPHQSSPSQLHCVKTRNRLCRQIGKDFGPHAAAATTTGNSEFKVARTGSKFV